MTTDEYEKLALRTEADQGKILARLFSLGEDAMRLDNAARGLAGDAGEVNSAVMRYIEYGKELDRTNLIEEVGDCLWRLAQVCKGGGFTLSDAMEANIRKLAARYGEKYSDYKAQNRDKDAELRALESADLGKRFLAQDGHGFGHLEMVGICAVCGRHHDVKESCPAGFTPDVGGEG